MQRKLTPKLRHHRTLEVLESLMSPSQGPYPSHCLRGTYHDAFNFVLMSFWKKNVLWNFYHMCMYPPKAQCLIFACFWSVFLLRFSFATQHGVSSFNHVAMWFYGSFIFITAIFSSDYSRFCYSFEDHWYLHNFQSLCTLDSHVNSHFCGCFLMMQAEELSSERNHWVLLYVCVFNFNILSHKWKFPFMFPSLCENFCLFNPSSDFFFIVPYWV